ncbi:MAG: hypothetical protein K2M07_05150 [Muribaculaceae bacterium]|nr:hypothetical protein [Muribaculaceae bacterium]
MKRLLFVIISMVVIMTAVTGKRQKVPMCRYCKNIDVYFNGDRKFQEYLVLDYIDSMYYQHHISFRSHCDMGYFKIFNDTLTLVHTATVYRTKDEISVVQNEKTKLDKYYTYNYRIEGGGDSIYMKQLLFYQDELAGLEPILCIERWYKCNGSLEYLPIGEMLYKDEAYQRDSLLKIYESRNHPDSLETMK